MRKFYNLFLNLRIYDYIIDSRKIDGLLKDVDALEVKYNERKYVSYE